MPQDPTNSQDPLDKLNGGDDFVPPHEVIGAAADKFAPLASTAQDPDEVADAPVMGDRLARQEEYAAQEEEAEVARLDEESGINAAIEAIDAVNAEAALEAQQAPVLRSTESERRVADALYGSLDPNELTPEELAMFDVEVEETKRRAAKPEMVSGTMTEEKDSLLGQAADLQEGAMGEIGQAIRSVGLDEDGFTEEEGVEKYGWVDGIEIDRDVNTPETEMFDAFYEAMKADDVLDNMGMVNSHTLTNFMSRYAIEISDGEVTPSQRTHMMTMISKGLAQRNGLELQGRPFSEEQMTSRMGMVDLAAGLGIYHDMESGRIASLRYGREGAIPYTDAQQKKREDRIRAHGVYDAGVKSHYRTGDTYEEIHPTEGWDSFTSWWGEMSRTAFDKMGVGLESRYSRPSATMAGYVANVLVGATSGHGALKATGVLGDLAKVSRRLPTVVKWVNIENSAAVTDYYMQTQGKQVQTWQGAVDEMSRTGQLKQLIDEYPAWQGVIKWFDEAAKDSKYIITGNDDQDAAALKQMHSGMWISLPATLVIGAAAKTSMFAYGMVRNTIREMPTPITRATVGGAPLGTSRYTQDTVVRVAKELGYEPEALWKQYIEGLKSIDLGSERGAVGGGKLPQFGRGADEATNLDVKNRLYKEIEDLSDEELAKRASKDLGFDYDEALEDIVKEQVEGGTNLGRSDIIESLQGDVDNSFRARGLTDEGATRAGQEGFLNLDPSNLWAQGKRFLKNLKSLPKQTAESKADAKASRATMKELEKNMSPEELAAAKELAASDEPIRTIPPLDEAMGEGRASGTYAEGRNQVYRDADDWKRSLSLRIEAFEDVTTLRKLDPNKQLDEETMKLLRRYGVEPEHGKLSQDDIDMAIEDAGSSGARAETKEAERLAEMADKYGIDMDTWDTKLMDLEEFLRKEGFEPNRPDTPDGGVRPDYPEEMAEWGKLKDDALSKFLIARKNYKMEKEAKSLSAETKSKLEYYGVRLQQVLAEGDELIGRKVMNRAIATRSYVLPDLKDADAVRKWSIKNYNTGLYTHADWYNITANWRMGQSFAGETGKQASEALEVYFNSTGGLKKRELSKFSMRQLAANTREAKTGTNITALGTQFAAAQGMPVGVGRMALQPAVEGIFRGLWKESDIARMGALAERLRNGETLSPDPRIMPREAAELDDDGLKHGAWNRAINFVFNPMADVNIDMGGMKATGEIGAGYKGTMKLFGQERDLQSASPLAVRALSMEDGLLRNVASGVVGAGQAVGRQGMGRIDRVTKKINFDRELSRQVASAFLHQEGNTKRIKDGLALNEQELVEIYHIFKDARHAIENGELLEHEVKKFLRDNLEGIYKDGEKVQKIHSGYSNDELIDTAMGAWKATQERQRELTLQQDLPLSWAEVQGVSIGEGIKGTSQMPVVGQFAMYLPTIVNNASMGAERLPVVGALYDMFALRGVKSPRGIKNLSPAAKAEIVEKQITGGLFFAAAGALYGATNLIDRFQLNSDGELEMWVETDKASIRENLRLRLSENPDFVSSAMDGANKRLSMEADMAGTVAKQWDDPTEYLDSELLDKFIIKSENGRSKIKVPRLGWTGSLLVSAITFFKGMEDVKDLPLEMIASEGMLDRLHTLTRGQLKAVQAHEMADGYKKMFGMFDDGTTIEATTDMLLAEMASPLTLWKGATSTSGEPLEFESELTKDYRAVSGLEEFMEAGGAVSIPRVMNHVWGDKHISRRFNGMGQNVLRPQRYLNPLKGSLVVEYKHETDFIEEMIREAKIVIKPIQHTSLMPGQSSDVSTYDYRNADGETMYEAVIHNMNSVVPPDGIEQDDGSVTYPTYIDSLNTYRASASYKKLQAKIDLGLAEQEKGDFRDESGMITNKDILAAMVAQAYVAEHLKAYRDAYKDLSAIDFLANGGGDDYKHKDTDESFTDVYNKSIALDYAGSVRLATEFALEGDEAFEYQDLSVKELQAVVGESMATELERVKGSLAQ